MRKFITAFTLFIFCAAQIVTAKENKTFRKMGDWGQVVLPISALAISYVKEDDYKGVVQFAKTYTSTMLITGGLKYTINAERPKGGRYSFPSGHASSAFAPASFLAFRYGYKYGIPAYLGAIAVGASRINAKAHHLADVVASATISVICANIFTTRYKDNIKFSSTPIKDGVQLSVEMPL